MKNRFTFLFAAALGIAMALIWSVVFVTLLGTAGIGVGVALGVAFACCGALIGHTVDKNRVQENGDTTEVSK